MPWKPSVPGEVPTLGYYALDWIEEYLAQPALGYYEPFRPYREQEDFILRWYELDPETCRFRYDRGLLGRPRGWGKSPLLAAVAILEALADVVPAGWDADGQPVGQPWSNIRTPLVQIAAVSEEQTRNTWQPLLEMLRVGPAADEFPGLEPMDTVVNLPRGSIRQITASARTVKGAPATFAVLDQTEEWVPGNGGVRLAQTIRTNVSKNGGRTLESPNAYIPGEGSVAEESASFAQAIREGRTKSTGLLWDHREAPAATDMSDTESLIAGLRVAYGDSSAHPDGCVIHEPACPPGHAELESLIERIWDPATDVQQARSDFLNQITHASDSWLAAPEWKACAAVEKTVSPEDEVTIGFDGSRARARGVTDATALVGCRVSDGHLFLIDVWEQPRGALEWRVSTSEVESVVAEVFDRHRVVGFYADPARWESSVAAWEASHGAKLRVRASRSNPIEWWMTGSKSVQAISQFESAVLDDELTHDGSTVLARHILNARRRRSRSGTTIAKEFPDSPNKIDAAIASVLAWQARLDALAAGYGRTRKRGSRKVVAFS